MPARFERAGGVQGTLVLAKPGGDKLISALDAVPARSGKHQQIDANVPGSRVGLCEAPLSAVAAATAFRCRAVTFNRMDRTRKAVAAAPAFRCRGFSFGRIDRTQKAVAAAAAVKGASHKPTREPGTFASIRDSCHFLPTPRPRQKSVCPRLVLPVPKCLEPPSSFKTRRHVYPSDIFSLDPTGRQAYDIP